MIRCPTGYRPYLPWRHRATDRVLREAWQEAARIAREPIVRAATDENTPLWGPYLTSGVPVTVDAAKVADALEQSAKANGSHHQQADWQRHAQRRGAELIRAAYGVQEAPKC